MSQEYNFCYQTGAQCSEREEMSLSTVTHWFSPGKPEMMLKEMLAFNFYIMGARGMIK